LKVSTPFSPLFLPSVAHSLPPNVYRSSPSAPSSCPSSPSRLRSV
jgi:hypothetical protein